MIRSLLRFLMVLSLFGLCVSWCAQSLALDGAFPGARSKWHGFDRFDFEVDGKPVTVVAPRESAAGRPWIWHAEFFGTVPEPEIALLAKGFYIVHMQTPDLFGSPTAVANWDALYKEMTEKYGLSKRPALVGISRGGLYCYNWAAKNPEKLACIYGDAPVCDLHSWPAGKGKGSGNPTEMTRLMAVYGAKSEEELFEKAASPIDELKTLAEAKVPLLHVYGDADQGVPPEENTAVLAERYKQLGGEIALIAKPGVGHVHGLEDSTPIVEFIESNCLTQPGASNSRPLEIRSRRELFVDRYLIDRLENAELRLAMPRDEGSVLAMDEPWEGPHSGYTTVIRDGDRLLMYYRGISKLTLDGSDFERTCLAESKDGIHWIKPKLGLFEFDGSKENNIVLDKAAPATHNFCPMLDTRPGVPANERFKAIGGTLDKLFAFASEDGLHWRKMQQEPFFTKDDVAIPHVHLFDSQNLVFWSETEQVYVCYFRLWDGVRRIARTTSPDFRHWSASQLMQQVHDDGVHGPQPAPQEHLYTNQTTPYFRAPQIYVALPARFFEGRQVISESEAAKINVTPEFFKDTSDAVFMTSRGGNVYDRTFLEGFLRPGIGLQNWVSRTNYPALNLIQTGPTEMSFYVNQDNAQPTAHLRRYSLRLDGFASVNAGAAGGELLTKPLVFSGKELAINFATSAGGGIRVELQDVDRKPYPGFSLGDCQEQIGNEIERVVTWGNNSDVSALAGKVVRVRFQLKDADLYAIRFVP
jgi:pimeloyl-ACP methyl ester carboxylesterase